MPRVIDGKRTEHVLTGKSKLDLELVGEHFSNSFHIYFLPLPVMWVNFRIWHSNTNRNTKLLSGSKSLRDYNGFSSFYLIFECDEDDEVAMVFSDTFCINCSG